MEEKLTSRTSINNVDFACIKFMQKDTLRFWPTLAGPLNLYLSYIRYVT